MWQRIALAVPFVAAGCALAFVGRTSQLAPRPIDRMAILVTRPDLAKVETDIRNAAAARNITVDDRSAGAGSALDWQLVKDGQLRVEAVYDAYRSIVQICFFRAEGDDYVVDFKDALRRGLARN